jgi:sigma-E factor negative regulatory protein RseC
MSNLAETEISHTGTIEKIENGVIDVRIISTASCVSCHAKGSCSASDIEEKIVEVLAPENHNFKVGEVVRVALNQSAGLKAVMIGYIFPFLVLLFTLIIVLSFTDNEGLAGLIAIGMLIPYYVVLYLTKKTQKQTFNFRIK